MLSAECWKGVQPTITETCGSTQHSALSTHYCLWAIGGRTGGDEARSWASQALKTGAVSSRISRVNSMDESSESKSSDEMLSGVGMVMTWSLTSPKKLSMDCNCASTRFIERSMSS